MSIGNAKNTQTEKGKLITYIVLSRSKTLENIRVYEFRRLLKRQKRTWRLPVVKILNYPLICRYNNSLKAIVFYVFVPFPITF